MPINRTSTISVLLLASVLSVQAQNVATNAKNTTLDFSIPDSPAANVLGVTPSSITKPTTPRSFATALLNGFDQNGNFQNGISLDTAPYLLAYGDKVSLSSYQHSYALRMFSRFQTSIATTKGTSTDKSSKVGLAFQVTLFDFGDPRMNRGFLKELDQAAAKAAENVANARRAAGKPALPDPTSANFDQDSKDDIAQKTAETNKLIDPLISREKAAAWNRSSWIIAVAPSWNSPTGSTSDLRWNGGAVWTSISYGFEQVPGLRDSSQIIIETQYHNKELVNNTVSSTSQMNAGTPNSTTFLQNSWRTGVRAVIGGPETNGSFEFVYINARPYGFKSEDYAKLTFQLEKKLANNLWLTFSGGGESGRQNGQNKLLVMSSFKWGTSSH